MSIVALIALQLAIGGVTLAPKDYLDGRAIADGEGKPVVMLTPNEKVFDRIKSATTATLDGAPATIRITDNAIELDGSADFDAASALAKRLTGKPPLPDSLDE